MSKAIGGKGLGVWASRRRVAFVPYGLRIVRASKTTDDPKKPSRPDTSCMGRIGAMFAWLEYWLECIAYAFGQWAIFKIAEYFGKLSVFAAVIFFVVGIFWQGCEAKKEAERRSREEVKRSYDILGKESQTHAPQTRILALATLRDFMEQDDSRHPTEFQKTMASLGYSGLDLSDMILRNDYELAAKNLARTKLSDADLTGADLSQANLEGADLGGAHLTGADLSQAHLERADLGGANLTGAILHQATLSDAQLSGAILRKAKLTNAAMQNARFSDVGLDGVRTADLSDANLRNANLTEADLRGVDLSNADLTGADASKAQMKGYHAGGNYSVGPTKLHETILRGSILTGADLRAVDLSSAHGLTLEQWDSAKTDGDTIPPRELETELSGRE
jgi:uncharacterized protein YjbI with pentapeptide repeats